MLIIKWKCSSIPFLALGVPRAIFGLIWTLFLHICQKEVGTLWASGKLNGFMGIFKEDH